MVSAVAVNAPHIDSHQPLFTPQFGCPGCSTGSSGGPVGNLTNHGGPVMHSVTSYAIFWLPSGYHFDTPSIDPPYANASDMGYEGLVGRYLSDLLNTSYYYTIQQYTDSTGPPGMSTAFGGSWADTSPYPKSEGSRSNPLQDNDIQAEVTKAMEANAWPSRDGNNTFFVFTGQDVYSCAGSECSYSDYCSYHSAFGAADGETVTYAYVPDPGNENAEPCLATVATGHPSPNGAAFADSAVNLVAHEGFEAVTDPAFNGWYYQDLQHEVADECLWKFGSVASDGSDITLNGHEYLLQEMWSNKFGGCFIPPTVPTLPVGASYQIKGAAPGSTPPTFTYWSGGMLKKATLSATPQTLQVDQLSAWNVTGTLGGSTSTSKWQTPESTTGTLRSGATLAFIYYQQYLADFGFGVAGGGSGYSAPDVTVTQFGIPENMTAGSPIWVDAGSPYAYAGELPGSGPNERWALQSPSGTVDSAKDVDVEYHHQYLVSFHVTDASGSNVLIPSQIELDGAGAALYGQSSFQVFAEGQQAWLDAGETYAVGQLLWEGVDVKPTPSYTVTVSSTQTVTIAASVYDANLKVSDYLRFPVSGASWEIRLANGTALGRTTASDGTISLRDIPLGRFNATLSYLGYSQRVNAHVGLDSDQVLVTLPASLPDLGTAVAVIILVACLAAYAFTRRRRERALY